MMISVSRYQALPASSAAVGVFARLCALLLLLFIFGWTHASADDVGRPPDRWQTVFHEALEAVKQQRYTDAEQRLTTALREAGDSAPRQALTLQAMIVTYSSQGKLTETRESVSQFLRLADTFIRTADGETARWYQRTAELLRPLGMSDEVAALLGQARRIESMAGQTTCTYQPRRERAEGRLSDVERGKAIKVVEALGTFSQWANGRASKDKAEYVGRLSPVETVVRESIASMPDSEETAAIRAAVSCFREAVNLWPRVSEAWATGEQWVREAAHALGIKSTSERRQEEQRKQVELGRASRAATEKPGSDSGSSRPVSPEALRRALPAGRAWRLEEIATQGTSVIEAGLDRAACELVKENTLKGWTTMPGVRRFGDSISYWDGGCRGCGESRASHFRCVAE